MELLSFGFLLVFLVVVVVPIAAWVSIANAKARLGQLERSVERHRETIEELKGWIGRLQSKVIQLESAPRQAEPPAAPSQPSQPAQTAPVPA